jgi:hypothetical protein
MPCESLVQLLFTTFVDSSPQVWDLRMYKETHAYLTHKPVTSLSVSQRGLLAVGFGSHVQIWNDALHTKAKSPYMRHELPGKTCSEFMAWRPYEDVLAIGHSSGLCSMLVPGAGEPNYDALEANPFESTKERREAEVRRIRPLIKNVFGRSVFFPVLSLILSQLFLGHVLFELSCLSPSSLDYFVFHLNSNLLFYLSFCLPSLSLRTL